MKTIICLVSHQPMANVIPVLDMNPDKVILVQTEQEKDVSQNIYKLLREKNIICEINKDYIDPYDFTNMKFVISKILNDNSKDNILLNITGGTKLMALGAYDIFNTFKKCVFYYDPINNLIKYLKDSINPIKKVEYEIDIKDYLLAHGYKILSDLSTSNRAVKKFQFLSIVEKNLQDFINFMILVKRECKLHYEKVYKSYKKFYFRKDNDNIYIGYEKSNNIKIKQTDYKHGDWLEDFLYMLLKKKNYNDIRYSVKIKTNGIENEIDVLATKNNKLELFSCKDTNKNDKNAIYEIEILKNLAGGTFGTANLIHTNSNTKHIQKVCDNLKVNLKHINSLL